MKWIYKIVLGILFVSLLGAVAATLHFYDRITNDYKEEPPYVFSEDPKYHFSLILNNGKDEYWQKFMEGVFQAAESNNIVIEYNPTIYVDDAVMMAEYIDIAQKAKLEWHYF